jgi:hypothetical protein
VALCRLVSEPTLLCSICSLWQVQDLGEQRTHLRSIARCQFSQLASHQLDVERR